LKYRIRPISNFLLKVSLKYHFVAPGRPPRAAYKPKLKDP
jgi:hypothetical protein